MRACETMTHELTSCENGIEAVASPTRTLLLAMPLANPHHPAIGLALLQASLAAAGLLADIRHLYLDFVEVIGLEAYSVVADDRRFSALLGDWLFADAVTPDPISDLVYLRRVLGAQDDVPLDVHNLGQVLAVRGKVAAFLDHCEASIEWERYKVVGFSTTFQQTMASLALAKRIKARFPDKPILFGGANVEGAMGRELLRLYPWIDVVVSGEAEHLLPSLVAALIGGEPVPALPGVIDRANLASHSQAAAPVAGPLDWLPQPDYADFIADRARCPTVLAHYRAVMLFESARGCWWGAKHHCTFCGLNGASMAFRSKSPNRAAAELINLAQNHGPEILVVDNILDNRYFTTLLPRLEDVDPPLLMHGEVKANLNAAQMLALARAGFLKLQPGIESLSTPILQLMRKGTTALRNIQALKLAAETGIFVDWSHLYGFPGETAQQYRAVADLVPALLHLQPPGGMHRVRADRYSPYWREPELFAIKIAPLPAYRHLHRSPTARLDDLAYHFTIENQPSPELAKAWSELAEKLQTWRARPEAILTVDALPRGGALVRDSRTGPERELFLDQVAGAVLAACVTVQGRSQVDARVTAELGAKTVAAVIEMLLAERLLLEEAGQLLSLPLRQPGLARAPEETAIGTAFARSFAFSQLSAATCSLVKVGGQQTAYVETSA